MNQAHLDFLASSAWAQWLQDELLPWLEGVGDLGDDVLEIGPGPGLTTNLLRSRVRALTAIELDATLAARLAERLSGTNVTVLHADATQSGLPSGRFSTAACFSMLHHVPSAVAQDEVFREVHRVLRTGGLFVATDSRDAEVIRTFHEGDVFVPVDAEQLPRRLANAGFSDVAISTTDFEVRFSARKPLLSG